METTLDISTQVPVLTVRFNPSDLPAGAVDQEDFAQFLDGMKLALDGLVAYDTSNGLFAEVGTRPHLTIADIRRSSVECDIFINFFINISLNWQLVGAIGAAGGAGLGILAILKRAATEAVTDAAKVGIEKAAQGAADQAKHLSTQFMEALRAATARRGAADYRGLPAELLLHLLPGLRKMAKVGAKSAYGQEGITVAASALPEDNMAAFNADAQRAIEANAKEALAAHEFVELVGTIEDPSRRKGRFALHLHSQPTRDPYIQCFYQEHYEDVVRRLYAQHAIAKVTGEKRFRVYSNQPKPRAVVMVSTIEETTPDNDLWSSHVA